MKKTIDPARLEILKIARELVINEYIDRRAQEHNEWLEKSAELWKTQRLALAYPVIPPYPTEKEIITRAVTLMEFLIVDDKESDIDQEEDLSKESFREEFRDEAADSKLSEVEIEKELDGSLQDNSSLNSNLPLIMKRIQDVKSYISNKN
jgi:hypothetical protein